MGGLLLTIYSFFSFPSAGGGILCLQLISGYHPICILTPHIHSSNDGLRVHPFMDQNFTVTIASFPLLLFPKSSVKGFTYITAFNFTRRILFSPLL